MCLEGEYLLVRVDSFLADNISKQRMNNDESSLNNEAYCLFYSGGDFSTRYRQFMVLPFAANNRRKKILPFAAKIFTTGFCFFHLPPKMLPLVFCHRHKKYRPI